MKKLVSTVPKSRFEKYGVFFPEEWEINYLDFPYTQEDLVIACQEVDYLFIGSMHPVTGTTINQCSHLKMIHVEGVGFDKVDLSEAALKGIPVCNNRAVNNGAVAEHTISLILIALRRTALCNSQIYEIGYEKCKATHMSQGQQELAGKIVGLVGIGAIGKEVAKRLENWGCQVWYSDVFRLNEDDEKKLNVSYKELNDLISGSDIITLHVPLLENTFHLINQNSFNMMKKNAILVNTARGEIIDQEALAEALESKQIMGAALDTVYPEPPPKDHILLNLSKEAKEKLTITPHIGGMTDEAFTRMLKNAINNFEQVEKGGMPVNVVNFS